MLRDIFKSGSGWQFTYSVQSDIQASQPTETEHESSQHVDAKLLAALDGSPPVEMTKQWRDERRAELKKRIAKRGAKS